MEIRSVFRKINLYKLALNASLSVTHRWTSPAMLFAVLFVFVSSCEKKDSAALDTNFQGCKILTIKDPLIISGNNNMLLISENNTQTAYKLVLADNDGNEIWNKELQKRYSLIGAVSEPNGIFAIADGADRVRISESGIFLKRDTNFFSEIATNIIRGFKLKSNGNYLLWGQFSNSIPYNGMLCEIDIFGKKVFKTIAGSNTSFSDCIIEDNGNFLMFGSHTQILQGTAFKLLITSIDTKGKILFSKFFETTEINQSGSGFNSSSGEMRKTSDGNYIGYSEGLSRRVGFYKFTDKALMLDSLVPPGFSGRAGVFMRQKNGNFTMSALTNTSNIPGLGAFPTGKTYSTLFEFNDNLDVLNSKVYNQGAFGLVALNSDGKIVASGRVFSFEKNYRSVILILK